MKRDVMESAGLEIYAELGLLLFILAFIFVLIRVFFMKREEAEEHARIPLNNDSDSSSSEVEA